MFLRRAGNLVIKKQQMQHIAKFICVIKVSEIMKPLLIGFSLLLLLFENACCFDKGELDTLWDDFKVTLI